MFEHLVAEGRAQRASGDLAGRPGSFREGEALWQGRPLADLEFEPFARIDVDRLEDQRLAALEERVDAELALGRHLALVPELETLAAEHPLRERFRAQLMLALYRSGRQAEGLDVYRAHEATAGRPARAGTEHRVAAARAVDPDAGFHSRGVA